MIVVKGKQPEQHRSGGRRDSTEVEVAETAQRQRMEVAETALE